MIVETQFSNLDGGQSLVTTCKGQISFGEFRVKGLMWQVT